MMKFLLMNNDNFVYFLYQKDFSEKGNDRYFLYENNEFKEVDSEYIVNISSFIVTHDYWLIVSSLYNQQHKLPSKVIDINLLAKIVNGKKAKLGDKQDWDISHAIKLFFEKEDLEQYFDMYYRRSELKEDLYMLFSHKLAEYFEILLKKSDECGELSRFFDLEMPVFNIFNLIAAKGIPINNEILKHHKLNLKFEYYKELKSFAENHNVLYELPSREDIRDKLNELGYDMESYSTDFVVDFLPSKNGYTEELQKLQKLYKSYQVFNNISSSSKKITPIVDTHSTSTSRIYFKSPNIQNISRKYRDIFIADKNKKLSYIDYDQFEIGIMAALSDDKKMAEIYTNKDAYIDLSTVVFGSESYRKNSKKLFLSYTYGMSIDKILESIKQLGGNIQNATTYFSEFDVFEKWKESLYEKYENNGKIETTCGNFLIRINKGKLSNKEKRSAVSHVVQGTGSYIFKKAILNISFKKVFIY